MAMLTGGARILLICWAENPVAARSACLAAVDKATNAADPGQLLVHVLPYERSWLTRLRGAASLARLPAPVAMTRRLPRGRYRLLLEVAQRFAPDAVFIDGLFAGGLGRSLAAELGRPYLYRSHNREHEYYARQIAAAPALLDRLKLRARALSIAPFERALLRDAEVFFDISTADLDAWRADGLANGRWLAPMADWLPVKAPLPDSGGNEPSRRRFDVAFVGNLYMPNNVQGVVWLLDEVLPLVRQSAPHATVVIAGSAPVAAVEAAVARNPGVTLLADVADPAGVLASARVLVNPVLVGSGVMLKLIDMLMTDQPIVTTPQGAAGLPADVLASLRVAAGSSAFAGQMLEALRDDRVDVASRKRSREHFSAAAIGPVLDAVPALPQARESPASSPSAGSRAPHLKCLQLLT